MATTQVKIDDHLHKKMKELAGTERGAIAEEYREALEYHIARKIKENMVIDSGLENFINERITKLDTHLASMLGRTGMDVSITLMGIMILLEKLLKVDREQLQLELRKQGAKYFATSIKEDKERKKDEGR